MLASLEREGVRPATGGVRARRPGKPFVWVGLALLAVISVVGIGLSNRTGDPSAQVAAAPAAAAASGVTVSTEEARPAAEGRSGAEGAASGAAGVPSSLAAAAAASGTAAAIESTAAAAAPTPVVVAVTDAASAPHAAVNPLDKLALNDAGPAASVVGAARKSSPKDAADKASPAHPAATVKSAHPRTEIAAAPKPRTGEDDPDTALVAAVIARLDRRGATPPHAATERDAETATRVRECEGKTDLLEARRCRNRVCDGRWGKVDACPSARAPKVLSGAGADRDKAL